jgi:hypothetical protein
LLGCPCRLVAAWLALDALPLACNSRSLLPVLLAACMSLSLMYVADSRQ